jgi:hypothetical protein
MWYVRYSDFRVMDGHLKRKRLARQLAPIQGVSKKRARELAKEFLATINKPKLSPETAIAAKVWFLYTRPALPCPPFGQCWRSPLIPNIPA